MKLTLVTKRKKEEMKTISTRVTTWFDKTLLRVQIYFAYVTLATLVSHRNDAVTMAKLTPPRLDPRKPGKYWQGYDKNMMYKRRAASIQQRIATQIITIHNLQDRLNRFDKNPWAKSTLKNAFTLTWKGFWIVTIGALAIAALLVTALHSVLGVALITSILVVLAWAILVAFLPTRHRMFAIATSILVVGLAAKGLAS